MPDLAERTDLGIVRECAFYEFFEFYKIHKFLRILKHRTNFILKFVFFKHIVYCVQSSRVLKVLNQVSKLALVRYITPLSRFVAKPFRFKVDIVYVHF